jgi:hypothetical protein
LEAYPRLNYGGGFELLRCQTKSRDLLGISPRIAGSSSLLKRRVGNGKVYVRPIQRDLSLDPERDDEDVEGVSFFVEVIHLCMNIGIIMASWGPCL